MSSPAQSAAPAAGDPHQQLVDAVHEGGPRALAAVLGDQAFVLRSLATRPKKLFTPSDSGAGPFTEVLARIHEQRSAMDALEARTVDALAASLTRQKQAEARARTAQEPDQAPPLKKLLREAAREAAREVSMIMGRSPAAAAHSLASQRRLVADMPEMFTALATAQVTSDVAHATSRSFAPLSPQQRAEADSELGRRLPELDAAGGEQWDAARTAVIAEADPHGQKRRHLHAARGRHVTVRRTEHGMATVSARLSALDAAKVRKRLSLEAERLRAAGDRRGHQAIQADVLVDTLLGREDGMDPTTLDIGVMITERSLIHPTAGDLAQIEGYGTAPAEVLREELRGTLGVALTAQAEKAMGEDVPALRAVLRRLYTHPRTGELVAVESVARAFPAALARFLRWRDLVCRGPYCDAAIRQSDHIHPHAEGGATSLENGQGLCALCNDKEQQVASVERIGDYAVVGHAVEWTSRAGFRRTTRPPALTARQPLAAPQPSTAPRSQPPRDDEVRSGRRSRRRRAGGIPRTSRALRARSSRHARRTPPAARRTSRARRRRPPPVRAPETPS